MKKGLLHRSSKAFVRRRLMLLGKRDGFRAPELAYALGVSKRWVHLMIEKSQREENFDRWMRERELAERG
jgi:hypothetical protein